MVAIGCRFSNQNTASLSPPLDSRSGHVTVLNNETWGNTIQAEVQKLVVNWVFLSLASATPETIHKEAEASLQGLQATSMGMGWRFRHLSHPSWGLQYGSEAILDSLDSHTWRTKTADNYFKPLDFGVDCYTTKVNG